MAVSVRSYLSSGVAVVGAGAVVVAPVQPVTAQPTPHRLQQAAVELAAAVAPVDPVTAITNTMAASSENFLALLNQWSQGIYVNGRNFEGTNATNTGYKTGYALPIVAQMTQNGLTYLSELPDIGTIFGQVLANVGNAFEAPFKVGEEVEGKNPLGSGNVLYNQNLAADPPVTTVLLPFGPRVIGALLPGIAPEVAESLKPILDFATTPISGVLLGAVGPVLAPVLAVVNSITNSFALLGEGDFMGALTELVSIPTNAVNAFLNGGPTLDLTGIAGLLVDLPDNVQSLGIRMGGLLSPGGVAGDAVSAQADVTIPGNDPIPTTVTGLPVGPIGAGIGMSNYIATAIKVTPPEPETAAVSPAATAPAPAAAVEPPASVRISAPSDDPLADISTPVDLDPSPSADATNIADPVPAATSHRGGAAAPGNDDGDSGGGKRPARSAGRG